MPYYIQRYPEGKNTKQGSSRRESLFAKTTGGTNEQGMTTRDNRGEKKKERRKVLSSCALSS
jgi:hypothetical protein